MKTFYDAGERREINPHFKGEVNTIAGVLSSEDITIHPHSAMAFISSCDRRTQSSDDNQVRQGAIFGFDLNSEIPKLVNLTTGFAGEFNPHGTLFMSVTVNAGIDTREKEIAGRGRSAYYMYCG